MIVRLLLQFAAVLLLLGTILFGLAGTLDWFGGWVVIAAFGAGGFAMSHWLARHDPALLKERMGHGSREKTGFDHLLLPLANAVLFAWIGLMAFDVRWHGTAQLPAAVNLLAGIVLFAAFLLVVRVVRENTFATAFVRTQPERGQHVISTGPYRVVRHPMYGAAVLAYATLPFALGSKLGIIGIALPVLILAVRTLFEEQLLCRDLPGYRNYMGKVRYRLVPFVW